MAEGDATSFTDSFDKLAETHESGIGMATRAVALHIASTLQLPPNAKVCDNVCGTGAVTDAILRCYPDASIIATDVSADMIEIMNEHKKTKNWVHTFDAQIMNFGISFSDNPVKVAEEISRTLKSNSTAVIICWKDAALFKLIFAVQDIVQPTNVIFSLPTCERWADGTRLENIMDIVGSVKLETWNVVQTAQTYSELAKSLTENIKEIVGHQWTDTGKEKIEAATEQVLRRCGYLADDTPYCKGISWVAWIGTVNRVPIRSWNLEYTGTPPKPLFRCMERDPLLA